MKQVVLAMVHHRWERFLLQLRDFDPAIAHPGHWGAFGGAREAGESSQAAMLRELWEEAAFRPERLSFLATVPWPVDAATIDVYTCAADPEKVPAALGEGQEYGWFVAPAIVSGSLPSPSLGRSFPVTPVVPYILTQLLALSR